MAASAVKSLIAMGHPEEKVRKALQLANDDIVKALEYLANGMPEAKSNDDEDDDMEQKLTQLPDDDITNGNHGQISGITPNMQNMTLNPYNNNNNNNNNSRYEWEWSSHGGSRWHRYSDEVNKILNNNLFIGKSIQINMNGNLYEMTRFDETTATQRNKQTNKVRNVRRKEINEIVDKFAIQRIIDIIHCTENEARDAYIGSNRDEERAINYILEQASKPKKTAKVKQNMDAYKSIFNEEEPMQDEIEEIDHIYGFSDDDNDNVNNDDNDMNNASEQPHIQSDDKVDENNNNNNNNNNDFDIDHIYEHSDVDNDEDEVHQNSAQSAAAQAAMNRYHGSVKENDNVELNVINGNENGDEDDSDYLYGHSDDDDNDNNDDDDTQYVD